MERKNFYITTVLILVITVLVDLQSVKPQKSPEDPRLIIESSTSLN